MTPPEAVSPNEVQLRADLVGDGFVTGLRDGKWRNPELNWPHLVIEIAVGDYDYVHLRLELDEYPLRAPHGQLWDPDRAAPLSIERWPIGERAVRVFRPDWSPSNLNAPYLPCDQVGLSTHPNWATEYPERAWNASRTVDFYLEEVVGELTDATVPPVEMSA